MFWLIFIPGVTLYVSPIFHIAFIVDHKPKFSRTWNKKSVTYLILALALQFFGLYLCILSTEYV